MKVPILQHGHTLLTSFQDDLTDRDGLNLQADLLEMIEKSDATAILMDVTSLETVDSYQAKMITDTAAMARLLGCEVVLSGIQPKVAMTMVEMGDLIDGVRTVLNIQQGLHMLGESAVNLNAVAEIGEDPQDGGNGAQGDVDDDVESQKDELEPVRKEAPGPAALSWLDL